MKNSKLNKVQKKLNLKMYKNVQSEKQKKLIEVKKIKCKNIAKDLKFLKSTKMKKLPKCNKMKN